MKIALSKFEEAIQTVIHETIRESFRSNARKMRRDMEARIGKLETFGDLKVMIKTALVSTQASRGAEGAGKVANIIPGVGTIAGAVDLFSYLVKISGKAPEKVTGLNRIKTDPQVSSIVSDDIEEKFLTQLLSDISERPDDEPLGDWDSTSALQKYIAANKDGRTVTGF